MLGPSGLFSGRGILEGFGAFGALGLRFLGRYKAYRKS